MLGVGEPSGAAAVTAAVTSAPVPVTGAGTELSLAGWGVGDVTGCVLAGLAVLGLLRCLRRWLQARRQTPQAPTQEPGVPTPTKGPETPANAEPTPPEDEGVEK